MWSWWVESNADPPTWLPFYSFVTKQYGGRDVMLNEYEWQPTTGNKKPRNLESLLQENNWAVPCHV